MTLANQVAVITGASSGIGWSLSKFLAGKGFKVGLIVANRQELLEKLGQEIQQAGGQLALAAANVGDRQATLMRLRPAARRNGRVDLMIANAGVGRPTTLDPINIDDIETMYRVNVFGVIYSIEAVLPDMLSRGLGHLAVVSSLGGYKGLPGESAYCSTKAAVNCYMEGLRIQLRSKGIHVTTICPGFIKTPMTGYESVQDAVPDERHEAARRIVRALEAEEKGVQFPQADELAGQAVVLAARLDSLARTMDDYNAHPLTDEGPM